MLESMDLYCFFIKSLLNHKEGDGTVTKINKIHHKNSNFCHLTHLYISECHFFGGITLLYGV